MGTLILLPGLLPINTYFVLRKRESDTNDGNNLTAKLFEEIDYFNIHYPLFDVKREYIENAKSIYDTLRDVDNEYVFIPDFAAQLISEYGATQYLHCWDCPKI